MIISPEIARRALMGAQILTKGELFASYEGKIPDECAYAIKVVQKNPSAFKQLALQTMNEMQYFPLIFGKLVKTRLSQQGFLASPLIESVFNAEKPVEKRLERITLSVSGIESITSEHNNLSRAKDKGVETDEIARNLLAEILLLDFLVQSGFSKITRPYSQSQPHVDVIAEKEQQAYAFEVTRKKEFSNWETLEFGNLENCESPANLEKMYSLLSSVLKKKNDQFLRVLNAGTISDNTIRVVSIKTSDYGFSECANEAAVIIQEILSIPDNWVYIDCVWLVPNISLEQSKWVCR
jgi:hypothetical protein